MNRPLAWASLAMLLLACEAQHVPLPVIQKPAAPPEQVLKAALKSPPQSLDPAKGRLPEEREVSRLISEPLLKARPDLADVQPAAAAAYEISPDGLTYTFHLRSDGSYWDGRPVLASDFVFAWQRLIDPRTAAPSAVYFASAVSGGDEAAAIDPTSAAGRIDGALQALGLSAPDDHTFRVRLVRPLGYFKWIATMWNGAPVRRDVVQQHGEGWASRPETLVTNGPFRVTAMDLAHELMLTGRVAPSSAQPRLRQISLIVVPPAQALQRYRQGEVDITPLALDDYDHARGDHVLAGDLVRQPQLAVSWLAFNVERGPFDNPAVRQAVARALDRSSLAAPISRPASTLIPSGMRGYAPDLDGIQSFDAAAARAGLEASRVPRGDLDGVKLLARDTPTGRAAAGFVQKQLKQNLDLSVSIDSVSSAETMSKRLADRDFQFTVPAGWEADYPDQQDWFDRFRSDDGNNISQWRNPRYDQLVDLADGTADDVVRDQLYRQAHRVLLAEAPIVVIEQPLQPLLQRRRVSTGLNTPFDDAGLPGDLHSESIEIGQH